MLKPKQQALTIIELIFVIIIVGIIAAYTSVSLVHGLRSYQIGKNIENAYQTEFLTIQRISRDIHTIAAPTFIDPSSNNNQITFTTIDGNVIRYTLNTSNQLIRTYNNSPNILADGVKSLVFTYYDKNSTTIDPAGGNVRFIQITLEIILGNSTFSSSTTNTLWNY